MNEFPTIVTEQLVLRKFVSTDANAVYKIFNNDNVTEFYDLESFTSLDQATNFVNARISLSDEGGKKGFRWAICLISEPDIAIGSCGFHAVNKAFSSIEIGYELNESYWGKNLAFEAVEAMLNHCFTENFPFPINRVTASTNLDSTRSIKLLSNLGFTEEGILREYGYWKNRFHDVRLFSLLQSEWKEKSYANSQN